MILTSCASVEGRIEKARDISQQAGFQKSLLQTDGFLITGFSRITDTSQPLQVYIEGDGLAFISRRRLSSNPTPDDPLALRLAVQDPAPNVLYLGRPCQYIENGRDPMCKEKYWSGSRFSEDVVSSMDQALDHFAKRFERSRIHLIGYSGGAAIAALITVRRNDVLSLRTVAGNLDHVAVNQYHNVNQLTDSLNPADYVYQLSVIPQHHFVGTKDSVIPEYIVKHFAMQQIEEKGAERCVQVSSVNGATHVSGWSEHWKELLEEPVVCRQAQG